MQDAPMIAAAVSSTAFSRVSLGMVLDSARTNATDSNNLRMMSDLNRLQNQWRRVASTHDFKVTGKRQRRLEIIHIGSHAS